MEIVRAGSEVLDGVEVKLDSAATHGAFTLLELTLEPGGAAARHAHTLEDEAIAVVEGELTLETKELRTTLAVGDVAVIPRGEFHAFANEAADARLRALIVTAPAGLEGFFRELAAGIDPAEAAARAGLSF